MNTSMYYHAAGGTIAVERQRVDEYVEKLISENASFDDTRHFCQNLDTVFGLSGIGDAYVTAHPEITHIW